MKQRWRQWLDSAWLLAGVVFILSLVPRVLDLAVFVGPDEFSWVVRSTRFIEALGRGDLAATYQTGHPGIALLWVEAIGAGVRWLFSPADWASINSPEKSMAVLSHKRQIVAVANALIVALIAVWTRPLFGRAAAWLTGFLLAFCPFLLTESRALRTEGLVTGLNTLALLALLLYYRQRGRYFWLSAVITGLALLGKVSALVLLPVGLLAIGGVTFRRPANRHYPLLWGGLVILTVFLFWPALWVTPGVVAQKMYAYVALRAVEGGGGGSSSFFLGQPATYPELGPLFYPLVLLYRSTPWLWLGLILLLWRFWSRPRPEKIAIGLVGFYLALYLALITKSTLKFDRYAIPMLPALNLLAAVGLVAGWQWLVARRPRWARFGWAGAGLLLLSQMALSLPHHPYYYTYWNPLLGGSQQAVKVLPVGVGGEGIDRIAARLNSFPDAETLTVATANSQKIRPLLKGHTLPITNLDGQWYLADYTFIYISQLQRGKHDPNIIRYLEGKPLLFTLRLAGLEYGWLYRGPDAQYYGGDTTLEGRATLHAYNLSQTRLAAGQTLTATLFFRNEGQRPTDRFRLYLTDADHYLWRETVVSPRPGFAGAFRTREAIVEGEAILPLPPGMPPGQYLLKMDYLSTETGQLIGTFRLPDENDDIVVTLPDHFPPPDQLPPPAHPLTEALALADYRLGAERAAPGQAIWLTLYWQAHTDIDRDYVIGLQLLDEQDQEITYWLGRPVRSGYPTTEWRAGQTVQDPWLLNLPDPLPPGRYDLRLTLYEAESGEAAGRLALPSLEIIADD